MPRNNTAEQLLEETRPASSMDVVITLGATMLLLALSVVLYGSDSSAGANQIALTCGAVIATLIGIRNGHSWKSIEQNIVDGISTAMPAILILFTVGSLIGAWMLSGTVPTMVYYGLMLLDPSWFYAAACLLCAITAVSIGSSWTVAGTLGVGLIAIAVGMDLSSGITAGAVISGAYFGDKMSPLSDTTNLAPATTGTDIFTHIRHMSWTTTPSIITALLIFLFIGSGDADAGSTASLQQKLAVLEREFAPGPTLLLPVVLVIYMATRKLPAVATILAGVLAAVLLALIFQRPHIAAVAGDESGLGMLRGVWTVLFDGFSGSTGDADLDSLLSRGGMSSMMSTVWLVIAAMSFGAAMERAGILATVLGWLLKLARSTGSLVATTLGTCFGMNAISGDQYMSIVLPGRMFRDEYPRRGLHEKNLSRALEDGGTITSPLVPWNTCGAYMAATLGVPTLVYLPYCFFNLVNPLVSLTYGYTGIAMAPADQEGTAHNEDAPVRV